MANDSYVPAWRVVCESWVSNHVVSEKGINTPVYQLYNAYIRDNPDDYMDIGQFGKVLRARYPYRKRRRGRQGAQLYVYQDVALISPSRVTRNSSTASSYDPSALNKSKAKNPSHSFPPMVIGNKKIGPILVSIDDSSSTGSCGSATSSSALSENGDTIEPSSSKYKENGVKDFFIQQNPYSLRGEVIQEEILNESDYDNTKVNDEYEIEIDSSQRNDSDQHLTIGQFASKISIDSLSEHFQLARGNRVDGVTKKHCSDPTLIETSFKNTDNTTYTGNSRKERILQKLSSMPLSDKSFSSSEISDPELTIDMSQFCIEQQMKAEIEVVDVPIPDGYPQQDIEPSTALTNQCVPNTMRTDESVSSSTQTDENYSSPAMCRMAIGRQWLDANLKDSPGSRTYAKEIEFAYAQQHPEEPIPGSSMAVLIRGKFPGRRKRINRGGVAIYIYENLELVKKINTTNIPGLPLFPANTTNPPNIVYKNYENIYTTAAHPAPPPPPLPPRTVIMTPPNVNTITVCNPPLNSVFNYQGLPYVALQVVPPVNTSPSYEPLNFQNFKQNLNFRPNPVNIAPSLNINPGLSYTLLQTPTPTTVQPLKFTSVQGQNSTPTTAKSLKIPLVQKPNSIPATVPKVKLPSLRGQKSVAAAKQSLKMRSAQGQKSNPATKHLVSIPSVQESATRFQTLIMPSSSQEHFASDNIKDKPTSTSGNDSNYLVKPSTTSISPLLRIIKEEAISEEGNSSMGNQPESISSTMRHQNKGLSSYTSEKVLRMMEAILPDMDVDDYISNEIFETNKIRGNSNLHFLKSGQANGTYLSSSSDNYSRRNMSGFVSQREHGINLNEVSSTASGLLTIPKTSMKPSQENEIVMITSDNENNVMSDFTSNQDRSLTLLPMKPKSKRVKKVWDEDIRHSLSENKSSKSHQKQNVGKYEKVSDSRKKVRFTDVREQDVYITDQESDFMQKSAGNYFYQTDTQQKGQNEINVAMNNAQTRNNSTAQEMSNEARSMNFGDLGTNNMQVSVANVNEIRPQLQLITSRTNMNRTSLGTLSQSIYDNKSSIHTPISSSSHDPYLEQVTNAVLQTARYLMKDIGSSLSETEIAWRLESALYKDNPATVYSLDKPSVHCSVENNPEAFPCCVTPALKELTRSPVDYMNQLLHHNQSCPGLGCSEKCKTLRAAYTHIFIFSHRCHVWNIFTKIFSKHSRACRLARCPLALCSFIKHELHLNGISVLPIQFSEERATLEEHFRRCERIGPHTGELHCRHIQELENSVSDPCALILETEELQGMKGNSCAYDIQCLLKEAHQNDNASMSISRMLQILWDMIGLHG